MAQDAYDVNWGMWNTIDNNIPSIGSVVNFSAGFGDALLLGFGDELRDYIYGIAGLGPSGVNRNSTEYAVGEGVGITAGMIGGYRTTYVASMKVASLSSDGVVIAASKFRNAWKRYGGKAIYSSAERAKIIPVSQRLSLQGIGGLRASLGKTRGNYNRLMTLTPGLGGWFNE